MSSRRISQKTFDDVVRENIEEFEMTAEDAVEDAVKQFESQGVDLSNIVKDATLYGDPDVEDGVATSHPVVAALEQLSHLLEENQPDVDSVVATLQLIQTECDVDLAHRCMAGSKDAYSILLSALEKFRDQPDALKYVLMTLCSLINGQPDLLETRGCGLLMSMMTEYSHDASLLELLIRVVRLFCIKHEKNRELFVNNSVIPKLSLFLSVHMKSPACVKEICICLRALTVDDDVRVPFGHAHEHAKMIVTENDALKIILDICKEYINTQDVLAELFATLSRLAIRNEFCQEIMDLGGLQLIIDAFKNNLQDVGITKQAMIVLKALAGNDKVKETIVQLGGVSYVVEAMTRYQSYASIAETACAALATLALRNPTCCHKIMADHGHAAIVQAMKIHSDQEGVQKQACMAIRNLVSRTTEYCFPVLELGTEELINSALARHPKSSDECKAALRDLGCKVTLQEYWHGKNGTLQN